MRVSVRLDLISKIGRELQSRYTFTELYSYLSAFKIPYMEDGPTNSKWSYVKAALDNQSDDTIIKIANDLEIDVPEASISAASKKEHAVPRIWKNSSKFRLFISHLADDKDKATRLKEALNYHSISGFVAHEDIDPTLEWQAEIESGLYAMDAMVAIHTKGFSESYWTQQEVGFALGRSVNIISLKMGEDPTGFISKHQALARKNRKAEVIAAEINNLLHIDPRTKNRLEEAQNSNQSFNVKTVPMSLELAAALQRQHGIDYEAAEEKAPVSGYLYKGIKIESRWGVESELETMKKIIEAMAEPMARRLTYIWCDSNAQCAYTFCVRLGYYNDQLRLEISKAIHSAAGGHNGVSIEEGDSPISSTQVGDLDPDWPWPD